MASNHELRSDSDESKKTCNIFISYQWKSQAKVRKLYAALSSCDSLNVFMDIYKIQAGMNLYLTLVENLQQADVILACVSRDYVKSKNCEREIIYGDALNKQIIPVYIEKMPIADLGSIGFILVRERYCNLYRNESAFDNLNGSEELKDILDGIRNAVKKKLEIQIEIGENIKPQVELNEENMNNSVIQFRSDKPLVDVGLKQNDDEIKQENKALNEKANESQTQSKTVNKKPQIVSVKFKNDTRTSLVVNKESNNKGQADLTASNDKTVNQFGFLDVHPVIKELKFLYTPRMFLDPLGDRFVFENRLDLKRGNEPYIPPVGWIRYGLKVKNIYPDIKKWLAKDRNPDEWAVVYHGFKGNPLRSFLFYKICDKDGNFNSHFENSNNLKYVKDIDINPRSIGFKTSCGMGIFCSRDPNEAGEHTNIFNHSEVRYKMLLQCRAHPQRMRIPQTNKDLCIINTSQYVRPYGILIKQL